MTAVPFYLDCDTGVDDALALPLLLGRPDVALAGIGTVSGNTAAGQAARNTLVPLDVTMRHRFDSADQAALAAGTPLTAALAAMLTGYFDFYEPALGARQVPLHDPLAAGIATGELTPAEAPLLGLRVKPDGKLVEDPTVASRTRVVLSLTEDAAPAILRAALRRAVSSSSSGHPGGSA
jgi:inosine-uridine nucleoside N-ribohydrolase